MRRQWLWPMCFAVVLTAAGVGGLGVWPTNARSSQAGEESEPRMSNAEYRYVHSQASHWRAHMIQH